VYFDVFRRKELTTLITMEENNSSNIGPICEIMFNLPYLVDGIINLDYLNMGSIERRIFVSKMRWTDQYKESVPFEINNKGIHIQNS